ncbi:TMAO reductase system periplasmic protein TorT [Xinfangfangia sp. D13-10-4-6]|uniref:TMAO reductase system periplasmic protein TorT n=1 Tax=Pseudogemmobacter hezensis TaxID=2737662 RepID=UPI0015539DA7|nr:TMAO reductase system periplasmic protein TorT [Pseudogemmobacter hezensis]NPD14791.1 TMAO reductase system periplasmic protein TorT [Pseudogemmobacter hezensis]
MQPGGYLLRLLAQSAWVAGITLGVTVGATVGSTVALQAQPSEPWPLQMHATETTGNQGAEGHQGAADADSGKPIAYQPLARAEAPWRLCILYPHLKDSYWLSVNHGMAEEARRLGVGFTLYEAGGYPNLPRQIQQARACAEAGADALIIGTVSYDGMTPTLREIATRIPVIAAVNDIAPEAISARAAVPWRDMGAAAAAQLARLHPKGSSPVNIAWFPGPEGAGWVRFVEEGFRTGLADSSARIVAVRHGDTGREEQVLLIEDVLDSQPALDYLVGSGPMAEAAVSILRARGREDIGIISDYMTHAVHRGILRGRILAAPSDFPVLQGRLAVEMAVRAIEGKLEIRAAGPDIVTVTAENIRAYDGAETLAPADFAPVFAIGPQ